MQRATSISVSIPYLPSPPRRDLVWAFLPTQAYLRDDVDAFFDKLRSDGTLCST